MRIKDEEQFCNHSYAFSSSRSNSNSSKSNKSGPSPWLWVPQGTQPTGRQQRGADRSFVGVVMAVIVILVKVVIIISPFGVVFKKW